MPLIQNFLSLFYVARTEDFVVYWLKSEQVPDELDQKPLKPDEEYLRIDLRSLRVVNVQEGLTKLYGMVNSQIALSHLSHGDAEFQTLVTPPELKDVDADHLDRYLTFNQPLVGPVPFRGGDVRIQVGLFSVASANLLAPYVSLLEEITKLSSIEFINTALPYSGLLVKGLGLLTGTGNTKTLEIGVSTSYDHVTSGWLLVMRADRRELPDTRLARLKVSAADFKLFDGTRPVEDYPYMILRFSGSSERNDWTRIPELRDQHELFKQTLRAGDGNRVDPAVSAFERYVYTCPDLLTRDSDKIAAKARADANRLYPRRPTAGWVRPEPLPLEEYRIYDA